MFGFRKRVRYTERDVVRIKDTGEIGVILSDERGKTKLLPLYIAKSDSDYGYKVVRVKDCVRLGTLDEFQSEKKTIQVGEYKAMYRVIGETKSVCELTIYQNCSLLTAFKLEWLFDYSKIGTVKKCLDAIKDTEQVA